MSSTHTSADDWRAAAELLGEAGGLQTVEQIGDVLVPALHRLFGSEFTTFDLYDRHGRMFYFRHQPSVDMSALVAPFHAFFHEHPVVGRWSEYSQRGLIMHLSEHVPIRRFLRTGLFNEVYRHQHIKYQIGFAGRLDGGTIWSIATGRLLCDYGSRETELSRFLRPRLDQCFTRATRCTNARRVGDAMGTLLPSPSAAYALLAGDGRILEISVAARKLLEAHVAGGLAGADRLPRICRDFLASRHQPENPSTTSFGLLSIGPLQVLLLRSPGGGPTLLLFQEPGACSTRNPGLTRRETEILAWISEGKTNPEIAVLLGLSPRTIGKHCQNLFAKLGVESRLSAALFGRSA